MKITVELIKEYPFSLSKGYVKHFELEENKIDNENIFNIINYPEFWKIVKVETSKGVFEIGSSVTINNPRSHLYTPQVIKEFIVNDHHSVCAVTNLTHKHGINVMNLLLDNSSKQLPNERLEELKTCVETLAECIHSFQDCFSDLKILIEQAKK